MGWRNLITLALGCAAFLATVEARADDANKLFQEGLTKYAVGDLEGSIRILDRARRVTAEPKLLARIHLYIGLSQAVLGRRDEARKTFAQALTNDPSLVVDPKKFKQDLVNLFEEVHVKLVGELAVSADRADAEVLLDGKPVGTAPWQGPALAGSHRLEVRMANGTLKHEQHVVIDAGKVTRVRVSTPERRGTLDVESAPAGAEVLVDGKLVGNTPLAGLQLPVGARDVVVRLRGYLQAARTVTISEQEAQLVRVTLEAEPPPLPPTSPPVPVVVEKTTAESERKKEPSRGRPWAWVTGSLAVAAAVTGVGLGISVKMDQGEYEDLTAAHGISVIPAQNGYKGLTAADTQRLDELEDAMQKKALAANVMFGIAGAAAVTSVVLFFLEGRSARKGEEEPHEGARRTFRVVPTLGKATGLSVGGEY